MEVSHAKDYTVTAVANNPNATVEITQVSDINGDEAARTATVFVTGEDGSSTSTTTIVFTQTDYWYKTGFIGKTEGLEDWERNSVFQDDTPPYPSLDLYPGEATLRFTAGPITDPGRLISPKLPNMGTLSFYASAEVVFDEHQLNVYLKTSDTDSTLVKSITGQNLTYEWQEVVVTIESFDSVQIIIEGICDINDDNTSRIHMDDFLLTYYDPEFLPDDVTLLSLSVGGDLIEGFDPAITSYAMEISPIADYTVTAEPLNPDATVEINQLSDLNGDEAARTATIVVTSADGSTTATITIVFRTPNSFVSDFNADEIILYPNPATGLLNIEVPANAYKLVQIFNLSGQKVMEHVIASDQIILNIENLSKGLFILSFTGNEGSTKTKFVKK